MPHAMSPTQTHLGRELRQARQKSGLSQVEVGIRLGLSYANISRWETGDRLPSLKQLLALGETLKVKPARLIAAAQKGAIDGS